MRDPSSPPRLAKRFIASLAPFLFTATSRFLRRSPPRVAAFPGLIGLMISKSPHYKPPPDWRPPKYTRKLMIPLKASALGGENMGGEGSLETSLPVRPEKSSRAAGAGGRGHLLCFLPRCTLFRSGAPGHLLSRALPHRSSPATTSSASSSAPAATRRSGCRRRPTLRSPSGGKGRSRTGPRGTPSTTTGRTRSST